MNEHFHTSQSTQVSRGSGLIPRACLIRVLLLVVSGLFASASFSGQTTLKKGGIDALDRPVGFHIAVEVGRNGPCTIANVNGVLIVFESPKEDVGAAEDEEATIAGDESIDERQSRQAPRFRIASGTAEMLTFGIGSDVGRERAIERFNIFLQDHVKAISARCKLTSAQQNKLLLAGHGDIKRFVDRAANVLARLDQTDNIASEEQFRAWVTPLGAECEHMQRLLDSGIFGGDSLFAKTLRTTLTREQAVELTATEPQSGDLHSGLRRALPAAK
jgi:hypothetical protein